MDPAAVSQTGVGMGGSTPILQWESAHHAFVPSFSTLMALLLSGETERESRDHKSDLSLREKARGPKTSFKTFWQVP